MNGSKEIIVDLLRQDIDFRRSTQWDIFSWCSSLLVAVVGGVFALRASLHPGEQTIISVAVLLLSAFSYSWLTHHSHKEKQARDRLSQAVDDPTWKLTNPLHGQRIALAVLGIIALVAIWLPFR